MVSEAGAGLELKQEWFELIWPEYIAALVTAILVAIWAFLYLGTSIE